MGKMILDEPKLNNSIEKYNKLLEECIINKKELDSAIIDMIDSNIDR